MIIEGSIGKMTENGNALGEMISTLKVPCSNKIHVYTCVATAGAETVTSTESVVLPSQHKCSRPGQLVVTKWYSNVLVETGENVRLRCDHVSGGTRDQVRWTREEQELELSDKVHVDSDGSLVIRRTDWFDMGLYTCHIGASLTVQTFLYPLRPSLTEIVGRK